MDSFTDALGMESMKAIIIDQQEQELVILREQIKEQEIAYKLLQTRIALKERKMELEIAKLKVQLSQQNSEIQSDESSKTRKRRSKSMPPEEASKIWIVEQPPDNQPSPKTKHRRFRLNFGSLKRSASPSNSPKAKLSPLVSSDGYQSDSPRLSPTQNNSSRLSPSNKQETPKSTKRLSPTRQSNLNQKRTNGTLPQPKLEPLERTSTRRKSFSLPNETTSIKQEDTSEARVEASSGSSSSHSNDEDQGVKLPKQLDLSFDDEDQRKSEWFRIVVGRRIQCQITDVNHSTLLSMLSNGRYEAQHMRRRGINPCEWIIDAEENNKKCVATDRYFLVYMKGNNKDEQLLNPIIVKSAVNQLDIKSITENQLVIKSVAEGYTIQQFSEMYQEMHRLLFPS